MQPGRARPSRFAAFAAKWQPDWSLVVFKTAFDNPQPDVTIASMTYVSAEATTCLFLVGLTVE
jgi:hypothetical protein